VPTKSTRPKKRAAQHNEAVYPSVDSLATALGLSRQSTYVALREGRIPAIRLGKRFIIPRAAISEWLRTAGKQLPAA
jgi:excisionase family DNA binding protein